MSLSSLQLDAFQALVEEENFSAAARRLGLTQGALSQRIQKLENDLGLTLVKKASSGFQLTYSGERLFQYCQVRKNLENEVVTELQADFEEASLASTLRIGSGASISRTLVQPLMATALRERPSLQLQVETGSAETLKEAFFKGQIDFVLLDHVAHRSGVETYVLGHEKYVLVESSKFSHRRSTYLDFSASADEDSLLDAFLKRQGEKKANVTKTFLPSFESLIDGVRQGLGRAILPRHLIKNSKDISEVQEWGEHKVPVVLHFFKQPFYSSQFQLVIDELSGGAERYLL